MQQSFLRDQFNRFLAGEYVVIEDKRVATALPPAIVRLLATGKKQVATRLLDRLTAGMTGGEDAVRRTCAACLAESGELLADKEMWAELDRLLPSLKIIHQGPAGKGLPREIRNYAGRVAAAAETRHRASSAAEPSDTITTHEERIFQLAQSGNKEDAKRQLFDLIVAYAKKKDFQNAERLREKIYEIDPMALMEIIHSGEIIEEEKSSSIGMDLLQVWSSLLNVLSQEEFIALYHSMELRNFKPYETLVSQGAKNDELFFINQGCIRVSYLQAGIGGEKELFLKNLSSGEIAGENFFDATVWTVSLTAVEPTQISVLKRSEIARLEQQSPGIESRLRDYYNRVRDIAALLRQKGLDRRIHDRFRKDRKFHLQVTGGNGRYLSSFKSEMTDISQGGLSFLLRITKKENIRLLLGRKIKAVVPIPAGGDQKLHGTVIGVQLCDPIHSDYSVHVTFDHELERHSLQTIIE